MGVGLSLIGILFYSVLGLSQTGSIFTGVDLRDLAITTTNFKGFVPHPAITQIVKSFSESPESFFPEGVTFQMSGPTINLQSRLGKVYGTELLIEPVQVGPAEYQLIVMALYNTPTAEFFFRKMSLRVTMGKGAEVLEALDIPISETSFQVRVGLIDRVVTLEDLNLGIRKIYPLGVGAFDEGLRNPQGLVRLLTSLFEAANLTRKDPWAFIESRVRPSYFAGRPFIRVINSKNAATGFGFHYQIDSSGLRRGFVSHGCMRLRDKDLYEMAAIVKFSNSDVLPLSVRLNIDGGIEHPYKKMDRYYYRIRNCNPDPNGKPFTCLGSDGLVALERVDQAPPLDSITMSGEFDLRLTMNSLTP